MRRQEGRLERPGILTAMKTSSKSQAVSTPATAPAITAGNDLGDEKHAICALDTSGDVLKERAITNHRESLRRLAVKYPGALMVMEVGSHSPWISRFLKGLGHEVLVANARKLREIHTSDRKSDRRDAEMLARIGRMDPKLLHPIAVAPLRGPPLSAVEFRGLLGLEPQTGTAWSLKEMFRHFWSDRSPDWAMRFFDRWLKCVKTCRLKPMEKVAAMLADHASGLFNDLFCEGFHQIFTLASYSFQSLILLSNR